MPDKLTVAEFYSEGMKSGAVLGLVCKNGHTTVPPCHSCRVCNSEELSVTRLSGLGRIVSFTEVYAKSSEFPLETPYNLALIHLEEGGNLLGIIENDVVIASNSKVRVRFKRMPENSDWPRIFFDPM